MSTIPSQNISPFLFSTGATAVPQLESGDVLTSREFHRRYSAMKDVKKAELIEEGIVYLPSPVRYERHSRPQHILVGWSFVYTSKTPGVCGGDNGTVRLDTENEVQPAGMIFIDPKCGGSVRIEDDYVIGGPELVAEVASSSVSIDYGPKLMAYRRNKVQEYLIWQANENAIDWFELVGSDYQRIAPDDESILKSRVFPGLWLDVPAVFRGDMEQVLHVLECGLAHPSHAEFVARLASQKTS